MKSQLEKISEILQVVPATYALAKKQSAEVDVVLDYRSEEIEKKLIAESRKESHRQGQSERQAWIGLDVQAFQTPYSEIAEMIRYLNPKPNELWVDLGAGYGRMGVVLAILSPEVNFIGYEVVEARAKEGARIFNLLGLNRAKLNCSNLADPALVLDSAELYFIYDFGSKSEVYSVVEKLREIAKTRKIRVIARGRGVRNWLLQDFPWLSQVEEPIHFENWSLFRS